MTSDATADSLNSEGLAFLNDGQWAAARRAYHQALSFEPTFVAALGNLANLDAQEERMPPALLGYRRGLAVAPKLAGLHMMLGTALLRVGKDDAGERSLAAALKINPGYPKAHLNLAIHAHRRRRLPEAERHFRLAVKGDPTAEAALAGLGRVLSERARSGEARSVARRAVAMAPASPATLAALAQVIFTMGYAQAATLLFRRAVAISADAEQLKNLMFCLHYDPDSANSEIFALHRRWGRLQTVPVWSKHTNLINPDRPLRVGYLSADLYEHPVGRNIVGLIEHHDPTQVEVCIYAEYDGSDRVTERIRRNAKVWRQTSGLDDRALANLIRADGIDVLMVLAGHTPQNRPSVAALKPAPIQLSLYDFTTSGLDAMDCFLSDDVLSPRDGEEQFTEKVVRLPCLYLHMPIEDVPLQKESQPGLTLGSCANPAKLNDRVIVLWARVLDAIPDARLVLKYRDSFSDPDLVQDMKRRFSRLGIVSSRVVFDGRQADRSRHLKVVGEFDVALDTFPFNGCTTTYEALWMGVPVVTFAGRRFVGRMSASMLRQIGLDDLVAETEEDYVSTVATLARDMERRDRLRSELRSRLRASLLLDAAAHARSMERVYRELWQACCGSPSRRPE